MNEVQKNKLGAALVCIEEYIDEEDADLTRLDVAMTLIKDVLKAEEKDKQKK